MIKLFFISEATPDQDQKVEAYRKQVYGEAPDVKIVEAATLTREELNQLVAKDGPVLVICRPENLPPIVPFDLTLLPSDKK